MSANKGDLFFLQICEQHDVAEEQMWEVRAVYMITSSTVLCVLV